MSKMSELHAEIVELLEIGCNPKHIAVQKNVTLTEVLLIEKDMFEDEMCVRDDDTYNGYQQHTSLMFC